MLHSCDSSIARIDFRLGESRKDDKRRRLYLVIRGTRGILRCIAAMIDGQVANQNVKTPCKNDSQWRSQPAERDLSRSWQMRTQIFSIQHKHWYVKSNITLPPFSFSLSLCGSIVRANYQWKRRVLCVLWRTRRCVRMIHNLLIY